MWLTIQNDPDDEGIHHSCSSFLFIFTLCLDERYERWSRR
jgi:hypothetical protein